MIRHLLEYINTWMHVAASLFPSRAQPPFSLLQQQLFYNTCSRINLVRRDRTDWFIHRFLIPCVPSTYVPYIFQNVLLLVVLWAQWENIVAKCVTFKVRIIDLNLGHPSRALSKKGGEGNSIDVLWGSSAPRYFFRLGWAHCALPPNTNAAKVQGAREQKKSSSMNGEIWVRYNPVT